MWQAQSKITSFYVAEGSTIVLINGAGTEPKQRATITVLNSSLEKNSATLHIKGAGERTHVYEVGEIFNLMVGGSRTQLKLVMLRTDRARVECVFSVQDGIITAAPLLR